MTFAKRLEQISSGLFFIGFVISKLEHLPLMAAKGVFNLVALGLYLLAYLFWISACYIFPDHPRHKEGWYGFSQFKEQYQVAALLGTVATILFIAAMFFPIVNIPAVWIFAISNGVWFTAEYHKLEHPPGYEKDFSLIKQQHYLRFAGLVTLISVTAAISTTIAFACPPIAIMVLTVTTLITLVLGAAALIYWLEANLADEPAAEKPEAVLSVEESYEKIKTLTDKSPSAKKSPALPVEYQTTECLEKKGRTPPLNHVSVYSDIDQKEEISWSYKK